jgi:hypothetical protein
MTSFLISFHCVRAGISLPKRMQASLYDRWFIGTPRKARFRKRCRLMATCVLGHLKPTSVLVTTRMILSL